MLFSFHIMSGSISEAITVLMLLEIKRMSPVGIPVDILQSLVLFVHKQAQKPVYFA